MLKLLQIRRAKRSNKIFYELILWFLRQRHPEQFESGGNFSLTDVVDETNIASEAKVKIFDRELVKFAVVQALHPQRMHGFRLVTIRAQRGNELSRQILVEQNLHACCGSC